MPESSCDSLKGEADGYRDDFQSNELAGRVV